MISKEEFIEEGKKLYGEQFDYKYITENKFEYCSTVPIMCNKHGLFYTSVYGFLNGETCFECLKEKIEKKDDN